MFSGLRKGLLLVFVVASLVMGACTAAPAPAAPTASAPAVPTAAAPAAAAPAAPTAATSAKQKTVGIIQLVQHPALDLVRGGILDALAEAGFKDGDAIKVDLQDAQGQPATTKTIADKFVADKVDMIISITTPAGQSAVKATQGTEIPVVFAAVSDAVAAGLVKSVDGPSGTNVTGVYNAEPVKAQMELISQIAPKLKNLGVVYNPGESNSVSYVKTLQAETAKRGMSLVEATVTNSSDVLSASRSLVGRVDAIYVPQDNTVVSALEALIKTADEAKLPLFAGDTESVKRGAVATSGNDEYESGKQVGAMAARVLKGEAAGTITPEVTKVQRVVLNLKAAEAVGLTIPDSIVKQANEVIK